MKICGKKIVIVGTGMVGMSFAYAALNQNLCDELVLIDINRHRATGEAMDLNHGLAFSRTSMKIYPGDYPDCKDADIVVICAGVNQRVGDSRLDLLKGNTEVFRSIVAPVVASGFEGIFLVATNPVDIMTRITCELSNFESSRVIGTGTTLDTARLRYLLGEYFTLDPRNVHAYVIGEHGDSEFTPWSQAYLATKPISHVLRDNPNKFFEADLTNISTQVRDSAYKIIQAKGATYYGIGMSIARIARAILHNEKSVLTVSAKLCGEYSLSTGVYLGNPCIISRKGIDRKIELSLTKDELSKLHHSAEILEENFQGVQL